VARAAGLSPASVSRWLNGSMSLPPETAQRIRSAIQQIGYEPNPHARRLSLGRSDTIALVVPDIANPFFARFAAAVEDSADEVGLGVILCATLNRPGRELAYLDRARRNHVDGVLFLTNHADDGSLRRALEGQSRIVLVDEDIAGTVLPKIFAENEAGGRLAAKLLVEAGHRDIAFVGGPADVMSAIERAAGFRAVLAEAGISPRPECMLFGAYSAEFGREAARRLLALPKPPTAIFAAADEIALGLLEGFGARGLSMPEAASLVAFDDVSPLHLFRPPVTAVRQPVGEMGRRAVAMVLEQIRGNPAPSPGVVRLPVEIVVRESVTAPRRDA
jgi:LacI family transcriptional regulator